MRARRIGSGCAAIPIALFDVDGTLVGGQSYRYLFSTLWQRSWRQRYQLTSLLAATLPGEALRRVWPAQRLRVQTRWAGRVASLFAGVQVEDAQEICRITSAKLAGALRPSILDEMEKRRGEGCKVVLASTAIFPLVSEVGALVGAQAWVGTPLQVRDGHYTGKLDGPVCNGAHKVAYVEALTRSWGVEVDWPSSWAYSDAVVDLPMLRRVGHPVAVAPEPRLRALAERCQWAVLSGPPSVF